MPHPLRGGKRYVTCLSTLWHCVIENKFAHNPLIVVLWGLDGHLESTERNVLQSRIDELMAIKILELRNATWF
jgi:predicted alpha/beta-fold hydrolase